MTALSGAAGLALLLALCGTAAHGAETYSYTIHHPSFGNIGTYTDRVDRRDGTVAIDTTVHVVVRALGIVVHREDAERSELWRDGRLAAFRGVTQVNGKPLEVQGEARPEGFVVRSPDGTAVGPLDLVPAEPWQLSRLAELHGPVTGTLLSTRSGHLDAFSVTGGEATRLPVHGFEIAVRHYAIASDKHQEVWIDARGVPVAFRTVESGTPIDFTLSREGLAALAALPQ
jgi:hypothetical protein